MGVKKKGTNDQIQGSNDPITTWKAHLDNVNPEPEIAENMNIQDGRGFEWAESKLSELAAWQ